MHRGIIFVRWISHCPCYLKQQNSHNLRYTEDKSTCTKPSVFYTDLNIYCCFLACIQHWNIVNGSGDEAVQHICTYMYLVYVLYSYIITCCRYLVSSPSAMTDQERDEIDSAAQDFIHSCSNKIENLHHRGPWFVHVHRVCVCVCVCTCSLVSRPIHTISMLHACWKAAVDVEICIEYRWLCTHDPCTSVFYVL